MWAFASWPRNCSADSGVTQLTQMSRMSISIGSARSGGAGGHGCDRSSLHIQYWFRSLGWCGWSRAWAQEGWCVGVGEVTVVSGLSTPQGLLSACCFDDEEPADDGYRCLLYTSPSPRDGLLSRMPS